MKNKQPKIGHIIHSVDPAVKAEIADLIAGLPIQRDLLIEYLHRIQDKYGYISRDAMVALSSIMNVPVVEIYEVATFYHHFVVLEKNEDAPQCKKVVRVCSSITCEMFGAKTLYRQLKENIKAPFRVESVPCVGRCSSAPVVVVEQNPIENASVQKVEKVVEHGPHVPAALNTLTYSAYRKQGGYNIIRKCHQGKMTPDEVIKKLSDSGLRGLGGAGFPVGKKWAILKDKEKPIHLAINIDEGEPGTFKDRFYLERDPHRFLEGVLIAHWAIEADKIYIYIRDEYTACRNMLNHELENLKKDPPCPLPIIELRRGAGAYICGEESAMIESIEGKRGAPRLRPPYVADVGLFGRPTLEHNMETLYWVPTLLEKGEKWFARQGRRGRTGLRSFSVSGRVKRPGVYLAPAGITVLELMNEYCGGMLDGHTFYGYLPGGASGGILPAKLGEVPLDFDTLQPYGCFIGSAAIIIFSEKDKARDIALNAIRFFSDESCGQCTPCRVGTIKAVQFMQKTKWDIPMLEELAQVMEDASICGLGQAAPNPIRSIIKYFPHEIENHEKITKEKE